MTIVDNSRAFWIALTIWAGILLPTAVALALPAGTGGNVHKGPSLQSSPAVVINEVAWGGTAANGADEWMELYNPTDAAVDLSDWTLASLDNTPSIILEGVIPANGFFLLERTDDTTVSDIPAEQFFTGGLVNSGEVLELRNAAGVLVDSANLEGGSWPAGSPSPDYFSMERLNPFVPDSETNWASNNGVIRNGLDANGNPLNGTPKAWNSAGVVADVGVRKAGPALAPPGAEITYTLSLSNSGGLTATAVRITDTLPPGMSYLRSTAPFSLSQPVSGTLVWQVGELPPESGPVHFAFTGRLTDTITGVITNTIRVSTRALERELDDNLAWWSTWVNLPSLFADLVVGKGGPSQVAAGEPITYVIGVGNSGEITAVGVILTDALPAGVSFVSQSSAFTFTRPLTGVLVWQMGMLPAGELGITWTVAGLVKDGIAAPLTNVITATAATAEANPADNHASVTTLALYTPTVRLTAAHYYALQTNDEAIQIANLGSAPADIDGWQLTDNIDSAFFPAGVTLATGESFWVADKAAAFRVQFGFSPDFEVRESDPAVPDLEGNWPGFANNGDEVVLLDSAGVVQDVLVYKGGDTGQVGWSGSAVQPYHPGVLSAEGQILYRKLNQATGRPVPDTDTAADWAQDRADPVNGRKARFPGWDLETFFHPVRITETAVVTLAVGPDHLYQVVVNQINSAVESLLIQSYTFENTALAQAVAARASAGVSVTILLEGGPVEGVTDQEKWVCQEIEAHDDGRCLFMVNDAGNDIFDRYTNQHAKFMVVDGERALIGSENLSLNAMPFDDKGNGTAGRRGVYLITDAPSIVAHLETLFASDADPINHQDIATTDFIGPPPTWYVPITITDRITYPVKLTAPLTLEGNFAFEIIQSPENCLRDVDALLGMLARVGEGDMVLVEQMYERTYWGEGESSPAEDPNLRLEAYLAAARREATVRVLLDGYFDDPDDPRSNQATCDYVREVAQQEDLQLTCQLNNPTGMGIHNKMVLARINGRGFVHLGSINGSELSNKGNRELAIQFQSDEAYDYLAAMFERDWPHVIYLPVVYQNYLGPARHVLISEALYNLGGDDLDREWFELYNPTGRAVDIAGWLLGDAVHPLDFEAMYVFPAGAVIGSHQILIIAVNATRFYDENGGRYPDYELLDVTSNVPDLERHPTWAIEGNFGLGNEGDELLLLDNLAQPVDVLTWGTGHYTGTLPHVGILLPGNSLERYPPWRDTDDCSYDFRDWPYPDPGEVSP